VAPPRAPPATSQLAPPRPSSSRRADLVEALERPEAERQALRPAAYPEEARDGPLVALLLDAQVGQGVLA
jgi:hypothetical protein